jgi:hypothetical protein
MAITVFVPGVAQTVVTGTISGNPWANVTHWQLGSTGAPWSGTALQTLATTIHGAYISSGGNSLPSTVNVVSAEATDLTNSTGTTAVSTHAAGAGIGSPGYQPSSCILLNFKIASRYRGGHGRLYWPGINNTYSTDGENLTATAQANLETAWTNIQTAINTALPQCAQVIPRFSYTYTDDPTHHKYTKQKSGLVGVFPVLSTVVHPRIATQRRRLQT